MEGTFKEPVTYPPEGEESSEPGSTPSRTSGIFTTTLPSFVDPGLEEFLIDTGVEINAELVQEGGNSWLTLLLDFAPALLLIGFMSGSTGGRRDCAVEDQRCVASPPWFQASRGLGERMPLREREGSREKEVRK